VEQPKIISIADTCNAAKYAPLPKEAWLDVSRFWDATKIQSIYVDKK
jgi:hypothetical protein